MDPARKRVAEGVEAIGQRLIASAAGSLSLLVAGIPAAAVFGAAWFAGQWIIGRAVLPLASLAAAVILVAEAGAGFLWLERLFETLDPSAEFGAPPSA